MRKGRFPTLAVIVLVFVGYLDIDIPWIPLMLVIVSVGWSFNRFR